MTIRRMTLETSDSRIGYQPGEILTVNASWNLEEAPESIEVNLLWWVHSTARDVRTDVETRTIARPASSGFCSMESIFRNLPIALLGVSFR